MEQFSSHDPADQGGHPDDPQTTQPALPAVPPREATPSDAQPANDHPDDLQPTSPPLPVLTSQDNRLDESQRVMPMIGKTDPTLFWPVLLVALLVLVGMATLVSRGALALAAAVPVPFDVHAGTLNGSNFRLYPGVSQADKTSPVGVNQMDCTITDLVITKQVSLPVVGNITLTLKAGSSNTPAKLTGLTTDISSLNADNATFQTQSITTGGNGFEIDAASTTLSNTDIYSPYLIVNSITLPGLSFSIK